MNGIRLAVIATAAFVFLQADSAEVMAQNRGQAYADAYGGGPMGPGKKATATPPRGQQQDQPISGPPGGIPSSRGGANRSTSRSSSRSSGSRRSSRSSRSGNNAIESNPLFQLLDSDGDGELSLEEIDAASRLLYNLDANEDDRITSDEVEHMADGGGNSRSSRDNFEDEEDDFNDRGSRSSRSTSRGSSRGSSRGASRSTPSGRGSPGGLTGGSKKHEYVPNSKVAGMGGGRNAPSGGGTLNNNAAADDDFVGNDKNDDGVLKRSEMPRSLRSKFTRMDKNKDGEIDEDEFYDYIDNQ